MTSVLPLSANASARNAHGENLGLYGRRVLNESESLLDKEVLQVARTDTLLVLDDLSTMFSGKDHLKMTLRHAILIDPDTGRLSTLVWLLSKTPSGFKPAEKTLQLLPPNLHEARKGIRPRRLTRQRAPGTAELPFI